MDTFYSNSKTNFLVILHEQINVSELFAKLYDNGTV